MLKDAQEPRVAKQAVATFEHQKVERQRNVLYQVWKKNERKMGKANFWYFLTRQLFPNTWEQHYSPFFHKDMCDVLNNLDTGANVWFLVPREHRKSFIVTIAHSLWLIIRDPDVRILLISAKEEIGKPFARLIRDAFIEGTYGFETFQEIYDEHVYRKGEGGQQLKQAYQFTVKTRKKPVPDPTFRAAYLGVSAAWRCDVLLFDDAVDRKNAANPDMSRDTLSKMLSPLPMVDVNSKYRYILGVGTRFAYHDPYGYMIGEDTGEDMDEGTRRLIMERFESGRAKIFVRHAFEDPNRSCENCPPHIVKMSPHGHPTMEAGVRRAISSPIHTDETLMQRFNDFMIDPEQGEAGFWHQYMNVCISPKQQKFQDAWFLQVPFPVWPAAKRKILAIDSASKDMQTPGKGDFMVALFGEYDDTGRLLINHGIRSREWTKDEFIKHIIAWCISTGWWPNAVVKEKIGEDTFLTDIRRAFLEHHKPVHIKPRTRIHEKSKYDIILEALQGPFERAEVVFGSTCPPDIRNRAKYELCNLGQITHDDVADTLALFYTKGIRVELPNRPTGVGTITQWQAPTLNLYNVDRRQQSPIAVVASEGAKDPFEQAVQSQHRFLMDAAGGGEVRWDSNPVGPQRMEGFTWAENE